MTYIINVLKWQKVPYEYKNNKFLSIIDRIN